MLNYTSYFYGRKCKNNGLKFIQKPLIITKIYSSKRTVLTRSINDSNWFTLQVMSINLLALITKWFKTSEEFKIANKIPLSSLRYFLGFKIIWLESLLLRNVLLVDYDSSKFSPKF